MRDQGSTCLEGDKKPFVSSILNFPQPEGSACCVTYAWWSPQAPGQTQLCLSPSVFHQYQVTNAFFRTQILLNGFVVTGCTPALPSVFFSVTHCNELQLLTWGRGEGPENEEKTLPAQVTGLFKGHCTSAYLSFPCKAPRNLPGTPNAWASYTETVKVQQSSIYCIRFPVIHHLKTLFSKNSQTNISNEIMLRTSGSFRKLKKFMFIFEIP